MKKVMLLLILLSLFLSGCMVGPDFKRPEVDAPKKFVRDLKDSETDINLRWWELLEDPHLQRLIGFALEKNKDLLTAMSRIREARASLGMTNADKWPTFDLNANAGYGNASAGAAPPSENLSIGVAASWELDFWGKARRMSEGAEAQLLGTEYALRSLQIALIAEVSQTYFQLIDFRARLKISKETFALRDDALTIVEQKFEHGVVPEIDLNQAQIQKAIAEATIPLYKRNVAKAEHALSILIGTNPHKIVETSTLLDQNIEIEIPVGLPAELLNRRPDISQALMVLKARNADIGVAIAKRLPTITLTGSFGFASNDLSSINSNNIAWGVGGGLLAPIFHFGKNKQRVEVAKEQTQQAVLQYEQAVLTALKEVEDTLIDISTRKEELQALEKLLTAAQNA
ncbi:efflux transporter outer membrane subunit, partial [bacterium]|nr:efflux transporter outer membrane subunit [bacterium]